VVEAGYPISEVARLPQGELKRLAASAPDEPAPRLAPVLEALERLDLPDVERCMGLQLVALGPRAFASRFAAPVLREIGDRWERGLCSVAVEHAASATVRTLLGAALRSVVPGHHLPAILFTTPPGERHELGVALAAVATVAAGGNAVYLGPDLPIEEIVRAATELEARAVGLGIYALPKRESERAVRALRRALPTAIELWVGGAGSRRLALPPDVQRVDDLEVLERKVSLLGTRPTLASA
jgi:hypothetical protein